MKKKALRFAVPGERSVFEPQIIERPSEARQDFFDMSVGCGIGVDPVFACFAGMENGRVVFFESFSDFGERAAGQFPAKVHSEFARIGEDLGSVLAGKVGQFEIEFFANGLLDIGAGEGRFLFLCDKAAQLVDDDIHGQRPMEQIAEADEFGESAFESAHIGGDVLCDIVEEDIGQRVSPAGLFISQDCHSRGVVGDLDIGCQALLESGDEAIFEAGDFVGGLIARQDDLFPFVLECIERIEEFHLQFGGSGEELDIVDEQEIDAPVAVSEIGLRFVSNGFDEVIQHHFARDVVDDGPRVVFPDVVSGGLHQVGFTESGIAVDQQRVVGVSGVFGGCADGGCGEVIGGSGNEVFEGEVRIQFGAAHFATGRGGGFYGRGVGVQRKNVVRFAEFERFRIAGICSGAGGVFQRKRDDAIRHLLERVANQRGIVHLNPLANEFVFDEKSQRPIGLVLSDNGGNPACIGL